MTRNQVHLATQAMFRIWNLSVTIQNLNVSLHYMLFRNEWLEVKD